MIPVNADTQRRQEILELVTHPGWERVKTMLSSMADDLRGNLVGQTRNGTLEEIRFVSGRLESLCAVMEKFQELEQDAARR